MPLSIRTRVTTAFLVLMVMAAIETVFVLYVQREIRVAVGEAVRTEAILSGHSALRAALFGIQASNHVAVSAVEPRASVAGSAQRAAYERLLTQTEPLIRDEEQRRRFARLQMLVAAWLQTSADGIDRRARGEDLADATMREAGSQFDVIQREMDAFDLRQGALTRSAVALSEAHVRRASYALTAIPLVAIVIIALLLVATQRSILRPLAAVARTARRLAGGDYDAPLPPTRGDEIGMLVDAFAEMRAAVKDRAAEAAAAHRQVRGAHSELLAVLNTAPSGLMVMNPDGSVRLQNRAAAHVLGPTPDDSALQRAHWQSFTVRNAAGEPVRLRDLPPVRALAGAEIVGEELDIERPDGRRTEILIGAAPLRDEGGLVIGAVAGFQDITRLKELDRLKDEFVAIVSHELRTPLTAIRGSLQLLLADDACHDPQHRELLTVASTSCERLVRIVNDMLDLSKIEAGRLELRLTSLSVATLVGQAVDGVRALAGQAGVRLTVVVDMARRAIRGDADRLTQALVNLLSNAIKFAPRDSTVTVSARASAEGVTISVEDEGHGISPEDLPRLFQKFQQLDSTGTRRSGGTGLGLVITKSIVEQHGGQISVESTPGRGTTFTLTMPTDAAESAAGASKDAVQSSQAGRLQSTILIAEDDAETRLVLRQTLERHGFHVLEAADGAEALTIAARTPLDALLLDLRMPRIHGHDVIRALRKKESTATLPILVLSGSESERHSLQSLVLGANTFIMKPAEPDALVREIVRHLRGRRDD